MYTVYLLECRDKSIYTGITTDLARRFREHQEGIGSRYTRARGAVRILHSEKYVSRSAASKREVEIKKFSRTKKMQLIKKGRKKISHLQAP
jgi:putative endonuclease